MNRFAVVGLGHFGAQVAKKLYEEGKEVIAIDADKERVQDAAEFSSQAICADATEKRTLEAIGVGDVDAAVVSLGERMDVITLAALHLKEAGVPYLIVKAISADHEKILRAIGADETIHPEAFAAQALATRLSLFGVADYLPILSDYSVVSLKTPKSIVGQSVTTIESEKAQVVAIERNSAVMLTPLDKEVLRENDNVIILGENQTLNRLAQKFNA